MKPHAKTRTTLQALWARPSTRSPMPNRGVALWECDDCGVRVSAVSAESLEEAKLTHIDYEQAIARGVVDVRP